MLLRLMFGFLLITCSLSLLAQEKEGAKGGETGTKTNEKAAKPIVAGNTYAIIIGVSNYQFIAPKLNWAHKDANYFYDFLRSPAGGMVPESNIIRVLDDKAKGFSIEAEIYQKLLEKNKKWSLREGDRLYFFFSGHGDSYNTNRYYLFPYDTKGVMARISGMDKESALINVNDLNDIYLKAALDSGVKVIMVIDACRTKQTGGKNLTDKVFKELHSNQVALVSSSAGQQSFEHRAVGDGGQGIFSYYLLDGLYGKADGVADSRADGFVSLSELETYLTSKVSKKVDSLFNDPTIAVDDERRKRQNPKFYRGGNEEDFVINRVDSGQMIRWATLQDKMKAVSLDGAIASLGGNKSHAAEGPVDSNLMDLYNKFNQQLSKENLIGKGSAEDYFRMMQEKWPEHEITDDSKFVLATEMVNFCQQKINLFLSGKGVLHMERMEDDIRRTLKDTVNVSIDAKESINSSMVSNVAEEIRKIKLIATTRFDEAAILMGKAIDLLKDKPMLVDRIIPKYNFLKAAALSNETEPAKIREGILLCHSAIQKDINAAYNYLIMGWLMDALDNDSSLYYYQKTVELAPEWATAQNSLGYYYSSRKKNQKALEYYKKAVQLDTLYTNAYNHIGNIYYYTNTDSARYYYIKALEADPKYVHAIGNLGLIHMNEAKLVHDKDYKQAEKYFRLAIETDTAYAWGYRKLSELYETFKPEKFRDSSIAILDRWVKRNPDSKDPAPFRSLGDIYLKKGDTAKARIQHLLAFSKDTSDVDNYIQLAKFYAKIKRPQAALETYHRALRKEASSTVYNAIGNFYYSHDADSAIWYYKMALQKEPTSSTINYNLSILYSDLKEYEKAIEYNALAIQADAEDASLYHAMGHIYQKMEGEQNQKKAIDYFRSAVEIDTTDAEAYSHLGALYKKQKKYHASLNSFKKALDLDKKNPVMFKNVATLYYSLEEYSNAEAYIKEAIALDPENGEFYHTLGHIYHASEKYTKAVTTYEKALALDPGNVELHVHLADLYEADKKYPVAINHLLQAMQIDSTDQDLYYDLGKIYEKTENLVSAAHYYRQGLEFDFENSKLCNALGDLYRKNEDYARAKSYYFQTLVGDAKNAHAYHQLGHIYYDKGQYKSALLCYEKSHEFDPKNKEVTKHLGDYYMNIEKDYDLAEKYYRKLLALEETSEAYQKLGAVAGAKKKYAKAIDWYEKARELTPEDFKVLSNLGYYNLLMKDYDQAALHYNKALKLKPRESNAHYNLACVYALQKQVNKALEHLELSAKYDTASADESYLELSKSDPDLEILHNDSRYLQLLRKYIK